MQGYPNSTRGLVAALILIVTPGLSRAQNPYPRIVAEGVFHGAKTTGASPRIPRLELMIDLPEIGENKFIDLDLKDFLPVEAERLAAQYENLKPGDVTSGDIAGIYDGKRVRIEGRLRPYRPTSTTPRAGWYCLVETMTIGDSTVGGSAAGADPAVEPAARLGQRPDTSRSPLPMPGLDPSPFPQRSGRAMEEVMAFRALPSPLDRPEEAPRSIMDPLGPAVFPPDDAPVRAAERPRAGGPSGEVDLSRLNRHTSFMIKHPPGEEAEEAARDALKQAGLIVERDLDPPGGPFDNPFRNTLSVVRPEQKQLTADELDLLREHVVRIDVDQEIKVAPPGQRPARPGINLPGPR